MHIRIDRTRILFGPYPNAFWDSQMRLIIPMWKNLHMGIILLISHMRAVSKCIWVSDWWTCSQMHSVIPDCIWGLSESPNAFGDSNIHGPQMHAFGELRNPRMHSGIHTFLFMHTQEGHAIFGALLP